LLTIIFYAQCYPLTQPDYFKFLLPWLEAIQNSDGLSAFGTAFSNYTGGYITVLWLVDMLSPLKNDLFILKFTALLGSLLLAFSIYDILKSLGLATIMATTAALCALLLPTIWLNGIVYAQADAFYAAFIVFCMAMIIRDRPKPAIVLFALAVSIKLQAIIFAPILIGYLLKRPSNLVLLLLALPLIYLATNTLYLIAGRPLSDVLGIYFDQATHFERLSLNAANPWYLIQSILPRDTITALYKPAVLFGLSLGILFSGFVILRIRHITVADATTWLYWAAVTTSALPFVLPKMHERFFFMGEVFIFALIWLKPKYAITCLSIQISGLLMYSLYFDSFGLGNFLDHAARAHFGIIFMALALYMLFSKSVETAEPTTIS
jgi:Gpi18-like mannosyltransferase